MNNPLIIDLFVEDRAHEEFLKPLIARIGQEERVPVSVRIRSARGGHGRAIYEYKLYQEFLVKGGFGIDNPDVIVIAIDGNCSTFAKKRQEILDETHKDFLDRVIAACPDPHVERWYIADPDSFFRVVGNHPSIGRRKCARDYYKEILVKAVRNAGHPITLGGLEFAQELAEEMDFYKAAKNDHSLGAFLEDLRKKMRLIRLDKGIPDQLT